MSFVDCLKKQNFPVHGTSYLWNGFIRSLSWITRKLGWNVGDGRFISLGLDPIAGLSTSFFLSEGLRYHLIDYGFTHLHQIHNLNMSTCHQSYWYSAIDLDLGGIWAKQYTEYTKGLAHGGIRLK